MIYLYISLSKYLFKMSSDSEIIKLNVGGKVYITMKSTLLQSPWFETFFSGKFKTEKINGDEYFIDRDPYFFSHVLTYLRNGKNINLSDFEGNEDLFESFVFECKYFGIDVKEKWPPKKQKQWKYIMIINNINTYEGIEDQKINIREVANDGYEFIEMTSDWVAHNRKWKTCMMFGKEIYKSD